MQKRSRPSPFAILRGHTTALSSIHFLRDGHQGKRYLLTGDEGGGLRLWDVDYEECLAAQRTRDATPVISINQNARDLSRVLIQQKSGCLNTIDVIYNPFAPEEEACRVGSQASPAFPSATDFSVAESFCRARYVTDSLFAIPARDEGNSGGGGNDVVVLRDDRALFCAACRLKPPRDRHTGLALSVCGVGDGVNRVVVGYEGGAVAIWDLRSQNIAMRTNAGSGAVLALAAAPRGHVVAAGGVFKEIVALGDTYTDSANVIARAKLRQEGVADATWSPDGRFIVTAGWDATLRVWDGRRRQCALLNRVVSLQWHEGTVPCVAISHDSSIIASGGKDGTIAIWNADFTK